MNFVVEHYDYDCLIKLKIVYGDVLSTHTAVNPSPFLRNPLAKKKIAIYTQLLLSSSAPPALTPITRPPELPIQLRRPQERGGQPDRLNTYGQTLFLYIFGAGYT